MSSRRSRQVMIASIRRTVDSGAAGGGQPAQFLLVAGAGQVHVRAQLDDQHVTVEGGQVEQRAVQRVPLQPGGPGLLPVLQVLHGPGRAADRLGHALAGRAFAERLAQRVPLGRVQLLGDRGRFLLGRLDQSRGGAQRRAQAGDPRREAEHLGAALRGLRVGGQPLGPAHVPLRGPGGGEGPGRVHPVPAGEHLGHGLGRRRAQRDQAAPRPDRGDQFLRRRRAEQPDRPRRRFLDGLEQRVGGLLRGTVGVFEQHHLPSPARRRPGGPQHQAPGSVSPRRTARPAGPAAGRRGCPRGPDGSSGSARSPRRGTAARRRTRAPPPTGPTPAAR